MGSPYIRISAPNAHELVSLEYAFLTEYAATEAYADRLQQQADELHNRAEEYRVKVAVLKDAGK